MLGNDGVNFSTHPIYEWMSALCHIYNVPTWAISYNTSGSLWVKNQRAMRRIRHYYAKTTLRCHFGVMMTLSLLCICVHDVESKIEMLSFLYKDWNIPSEIRQCHGCWCPGSLSPDYQQPWYCYGKNLCAECNHLRPRWTHDVIMTPLWHQNDVATSFSYNDVIFTSSVHWVISILRNDRKRKYLFTFLEKQNKTLQQGGGGGGDNLEILFFGVCPFTGENYVMCTHNYILASSQWIAQRQVMHHQRVVHIIYAWRHNLIFLRTKWLPFRRRYFQMHYREWKFLYFDYNFTEVSFKGSNWQ